MIISSSEYQRKMESEIKHYQDVFKDSLFVPVPTIWRKVEDHFSNSIEDQTGVRKLWEYVARHVNGKSHISLLGLGSGACGIELERIRPLLSAQNVEMELTCIDINEQVLEQAKSEAHSRNTDFRAVVQDINEITIEPNRYDVIVAYAALHHFVELDHIASEINKGLSPGGIFVTVDIPTKNGYLMWDETYEIVQSIWKTMPIKFKIAHTGYPEPTYVEHYPNIDYSVNSFECINSEAILPALRKHLTEIDYAPGLAISRRFFDTMFGPNYDYEQKLDRSIFEYITSIDKYYIQSELLKPETFFGAYYKK
jgi:ubiquinone/menaquinone biosynthesis C-methylase UbiE